MDWRGITFDWTRARAFLVTAEEGSLSAAARALGLTQPTLGRQVTGFEDELGVTLFTRAGKRMELTDAGLKLIDHVRAMGEAANALSLAASGAAQDIAGDVTVTASDLYSAHLLPPVVAALRQEAPRLRVTIVASNAVRDLMRREADIAIRHVRPTQPDLTAKLITHESAWLYGAPSLLDPLEPLASPQDLSDVPFIGFDGTDTYLQMLREQGYELRAENFPVLSEDHHVRWQLARQGVGHWLPGPGGWGMRIRRCAAHCPEAIPSSGFPSGWWLIGRCTIRGASGLSTTGWPRPSPDACRRPET